MLGLALNACAERNGGTGRTPSASRELLVTARELWRGLPEIEDERDRWVATRRTFRLIHIADILAVTAGA